MNLGVQYYRAPFPDAKYWEEDFRRIRESGLNTVQLWISWGWVEATPDRFVYDDYDRLVELAGKHHLGLVLSTIAEIQPNWIHRVIPGCELVDNRGNRIRSVARCEHHFGLTPGGCTDHPEVWRRMARFLEMTGRRYAGLAHLRGWDVWNELRWNVHADAPVCYCEHTLAAFRDWLKERFGSLEGLNAAWKRRYAEWVDVEPGRGPDLPYTEMIAFEEFICARAAAHARRRYEILKAADPEHPVTAHAADPSPLMAGGATEFAVNRGNDWALAEVLDGIGCSSFPQWAGIDDADFGMRIDMVRSAAGKKKLWLSELQGGRAAVGFEIFGKVHASRQQRWLWNGLASGADTLLIWCWRDEVFGRESSGFGLDGNDGLAPERLEAIKITGSLWEKHAALFDHYRPDPAAVGILFSPQSYFLDWAQEADAARMRDALTGYARALTRNSVPCRFLEATRTECFRECKIIFLPRVPVLDPAQEEALLEFVREGGVLFAESEAGAFSSAGFYRYPEDRFTVPAGVVEIGRRTLEEEWLSVEMEGFRYRLKGDQWLTPPVGAAPDELFSVRKFGQGRIIYCGTYLGNAYRRTPYADFERLIRDLVRLAEATPAIEVISPPPEPDNFLYLKYGRSEGKSLLFVFFPPKTPVAELRIGGEHFRSGRAVELFSGRKYEIRKGKLVAEPGRFRIAVLAEE